MERQNDLESVLRKRLLSSSYFSIKDNLRFTFFVMKDKNDENAELQNRDFFDRISCLPDGFTILFTISHSKSSLAIYDNLVINEDLRVNYKMFSAKIVIPVSLTAKADWIAKLALRLYTHSNIEGLTGGLVYKFVDTCATNTLLAGSLSRADPNMILQEITADKLSNPNLFCFGAENREFECVDQPYHFHFARHDIQEVPFPDPAIEILPIDYYPIDEFCFWNGNNHDWTGNPLRQILITKLDNTAPEDEKVEHFNQLGQQVHNSLTAFQEKFKRTLVYHLLVVSHPRTKPTMQNLGVLWRDNDSTFGIYTGCTTVDSDYRLSLFYPKRESPSISKFIDVNAEVFLLGYNDALKERFNQFGNIHRGLQVEGIRIEMFKEMYERRDSLTRFRKLIPINIKSEYVPMLHISEAELRQAILFMLEDTQLLDERSLEDPNNPDLPFTFLDNPDLFEIFPGYLRVIRHIPISDEYRTRAIMRRLRRPQ